MLARTVLDVHTPYSSFAILHSLTEESISDLYDRLSKKVHTDYRGEQVGPGWLKYEYNDSIWNLDDDSDYSIFTWRQRELRETASHNAGGGREVDPHPERVASSSRVTLVNPEPNHGGPSEHQPKTTTPTLHLHNPSVPLPGRDAYCNPSYYVFHPSRTHHCHAPPASIRAPSHTSKKSRQSVESGPPREEVPKIKKQFEKFHSENGVRTVMGSIGPVENVRMLLKAGHRHVYISRKFAVKHGFIPPDSAPGNHGYAGLISIGDWPITLTPSASSPIPKKGKQLDSPSAPAQDIPPNTTPFPQTPPRRGVPYSSSQITNQHQFPYQPRDSVSMFNPFGRGAPATSALIGAPRPPQSTRSSTTTRSNQNRYQKSYEHTAPQNGLKVVMVEVYLSEEPHFDVVLGRSFFEKREVKISVADPTDVWCLDTGEKIECELVILKDGRGEIVTVT